MMVRHLLAEPTRARRFLGNFLTHAIFGVLIVVAMVASVRAQTTGGCTSSTLGADTLVTCTGNGTLTIPAGVSSVRYLIVAGGGGGGGIGTGNEDGAGGGGAGGVLAGSGFAVTPGVYNVVVGAGGTAGDGTTNGGNGGDSSFSTLTAIGGGGGAREGGVDGNDGGSGGGGSDNDNGGSGTAGQGNDGGNGNNNDGGGGGGGAGGAGQNGTNNTGGDGGPGISDDITGVSLTYGGGGGGGADDGGAGGAGGAGGGASAPTGRGPGVAGTANTGGGGSGATGSGGGAAFSGGAGGSGIVVIRYSVTGGGGLQAFYQMEQAAWTGAAGEVIDSSGNGRDGVRIGAAQTTAAGYVCRGAQIPLNTSAGQRDGVDTGFDINTIGNRGSISFWYQAAADWNSGTARQLFDASAEPAGADPYFFASVQANGVLRFALEDVNDGDYLVSSAPQGFAAGTWVHVAVTWQLASAPDNRIRVYINGTQAGEAGTTQQNLSTTLGNLIIGDNASNYFASGSTPNSANGVIDEFRVYDFEQTAAEISVDMNATSPCPGPVAEYRLDELSWNGTPGEVLDSSPNGLNGRAVGGAVPVPAQVCNGAQLNIPPGPQTAYLEIADDPLLDITSALTVTAWVNPSVYPPNGLMAVASKDTNWEFHITSTGQVNWWWNTGAAQLFTGAGAVPLNTWTHIAITFAQGQQIIYINGAPSASGTDGAALFTNNLPLQIGDDQLFGGGSRRFRGLIDEVQIHDRTLSAAEVMAIMNTTRPCLSAVDHYYVQHAASGVNCQAETITITAHDINHIPFSAQSRTITITAAQVAGAAGTHGDYALVSGTGALNNGAVDDGVATYSFGIAESQVVLSYKNTWVQTVNLSVNDGTATDTSGTASADPGYDQNLSFVPSGFRFVDAGDNVIPNQVAGVTDGPFYLQAIQTGAGGCTSPGPCTGVCTVPAAFGDGASVDIDLAFRCDDPTTCQPGQQVSIINNGATSIAANPATGVTAWTTKSVVFGANGRAAFNMTYPDVGAISLHARHDIPLLNGGASGNLMTGASNGFVVSPYGFVIASTAPNEIKRSGDGFVNPGATTAADVPFFIRAGEDFSVTVTAVNQGGTATPNYGRESAPETVRLTANLVGGLGLTNNPPLSNPTSFGPFASGRATGTTFSWGEVGIITLTPERRRRKLPRGRRRDGNDQWQRWPVRSL